MIENLKLITTENFDDIPCDFYKNINDEYLVTREQIGTALGYKNPSKAIEKIHIRHKERLDKYSCLIKSMKINSSQTGGVSTLTVLFRIVSSILAKVLWKFAGGLVNLLQTSLWIGAGM